MPGHWKRKRKRRRAQPRHVLAHLTGARLGPADDEATALRELLEGLPERVALGQHLALAPGHVGLVLVLQERPDRPHRGLVVLTDVELLDDRDLAGRRQAAALALGVVEAELPLELGQLRVRVEQPGVGQAGRPQDGLVVVRGEPDGRPRHLRRPQRELLLVQPEAVPLRGHRLALEQPAHDVELLLEHAQALLGQPERVVLLLPVAEPQAEHEAPVGDGIERGRVLGDLDRIEQREQEDAGAHAHLPRLGGDAREQRHELQHLERLREEVLPGRDVGEAELARQPHLLAAVARDLARGHRGRVLRRQEEAEPRRRQSALQWVGRTFGLSVSRTRASVARTRAEAR